MSVSIFMRGDPLDLTDLFYLAYTYGTTTYIYSLNSSNYSTNGVQPVAGFLEMTSSYSSYSPVQFIITSLGSNTYSLQSGNSYLGLNSSNVIDLVSSTATAFKFTVPSSMSSYNIYNILNTIYPGIPYSLEINGNINKWYIFTPTNTSSWNYYVISSQNATPFFFPVNIGQISVWQVTSSYPNGACFYSTNNSSLGIEWLYNWTTGTSTNCDTQGSLNSTYNNCYFSDLLSCEAMYAYNLCTGSNLCGSCMGNTSTSGLQCYYNSPGSDPPLFQSSVPGNSNSSAVQLNSSSSSSGGSSTTWIIAFALFVILITIICLIMWFYMKNKNKNKGKPKKSYPIDDISNITTDNISKITTDDKSSLS